MHPGWLVSPSLSPLVGVGELPASKALQGDGATTAPQGAAARGCSQPPVTGRSTQRRLLTQKTKKTPRLKGCQLQRHNLNKCPQSPGQLQPTRRRARGGLRPKHQVSKAQAGGKSEHRPMAIQPVGGPSLATIRGWGGCLSGSWSFLLKPAQS